MNNDLRSIWMEVEGHLTQISENELREVLLLKSKIIINRFRWMLGLGTAICAGVLIFLVVASFSLQNDVLYVINNSVLAILLIIALVYNIRVFYDLESVSGESSSVFHLLKEKIRKIEKAMQQKKQLLLLPVYILLLLLAVNVYYSGGSFIGAFRDEENLWGLSFGFLSGLIVAVYFERKINWNQANDLKALKAYIHELEAFD